MPWPFVLVSLVSFVTSLPYDFLRYHGSNWTPVFGEIEDRYTFAADECHSGTSCCHKLWEEYFLNKPAGYDTVTPQLREIATRLAASRVMGFAIDVATMEPLISSLRLRIDPTARLRWFKCNDKLPGALQPVVSATWEGGLRRNSRAFKMHCDLEKARMWKLESTFIVRDLHYDPHRVSETATFEALDPHCVPKVKKGLSAWVRAFLRRCITTNHKQTGKYLQFKDNRNGDQLFAPTESEAYEHAQFQEDVPLTEPGARYVTLTTTLDPDHKYTFCDRGQQDMWMGITPIL